MMIGHECSEKVEIKNPFVYKDKDNSYIITFNTNINNIRHEVRGETRAKAVLKLALCIKRVLNVR